MDKQRSLVLADPFYVRTREACAEAMCPTRSGNGSELWPRAGTHVRFVLEEAADACFTTTVHNGQQCLRYGESAGAGMRVIGAVECDSGLVSVFEPDPYGRSDVPLDWAALVGSVLRGMGGEDASSDAHGHLLACAQLPVHADRLAVYADVVSSADVPVVRGLVLVPL